MKPPLALVVSFIAACGSTTGPPAAPAAGTPTAGGSCAVARPDFGVAAAADLDLFAYDANAPLSLQVAVESANDGVELSAISFNSPAGGSATGLLFDPVARFTGPEDASSMAGLSCEARAGWFRDVAPIEPIRFVAHASPTALLLQNGGLDNLVPVADAQALHAAAPEPRTVLWYEAGHGLDQRAVVDRLDWLREEIGLDARP
jgi:fermentation-respiration switch protein FrsA (DUF1100 family)